MKKTQNKVQVPDITEFTDKEGKKWVQTSTDDLFSMKEINEILESIEKDKSDGEILLARVDFQTVDKEYYNAAVMLQEKLNKQTDILKKIITESRETIERKNTKLKELIEYIKKLHTFLAYIKTSQESPGDIKIPSGIKLAVDTGEDESTPAFVSVYEEVTEVDAVIKMDTDSDIGEQKK